MNLPELITAGLSAVLSLLIVILLVFRLVLLIMSNVPTPTSWDYIAVSVGLVIVGGKFALCLMVFLHAMSITNPYIETDKMFIGIVMGLNVVIIGFYIAAMFVIGGQDPSGLTTSVLLFCVIIVGVELISTGLALLFLFICKSSAQPTMMMPAMQMYMPVQQLMP